MVVIRPLSALSLGLWHTCNSRAWIDKGDETVGIHSPLDDLFAMLWEKIDHDKYWILRNLADQGCGILQD
jgi:hypothetical protein